MRSSVAGRHTSVRPSEQALSLTHHSTLTVATWSSIFAKAEKKLKVYLLHFDKMRTKWESLPSTRRGGQVTNRKNKNDWLPSLVRLQPARRTRTKNSASGSSSEKSKQHFSTNWPIPYRGGAIFRSRRRHVFDGGPQCPLFTRNHALSFFFFILSEMSSKSPSVVVRRS